jgi:hypothetical protein
MSMVERLSGDVQDIQHSIRTSSITGGNPYGVGLLNLSPTNAVLTSGGLGTLGLAALGSNPTQHNSLAAAAERLQRKPDKKS